MRMRDIQLHELQDPRVVWSGYVDKLDERKFRIVCVPGTDDYYTIVEVRAMDAMRQFAWHPITDQEVILAVLLRVVWSL